MRRDRANLFDELIHAIHTRELVEGHYRTIKEPTKSHGQQHILGSIDWNWEVKLILEEIYSVDKNRYGRPWERATRR